MVVLLEGVPGEAVQQSSLPSGVISHHQEGEVICCLVGVWSC